MRSRALALAFLLFGSAAPGATITIVNKNRTGAGFNDRTPATPVGGNTGTTVGAQRLICFQEAARIWGQLLPSGVTIAIDATFDPLPCDAGGAVLGQAGAQSIYSDFDGAPLPGTWYPEALANKLSGVDQDPTTSDIQAQFNSNLTEAACGFSWYYGLDGNHGGAIDLVTVLLHEFGHGLGFQSFVDETTGELYPPEAPQNDVFTHFIYDGARGQDWESMSDAGRMQSAVSGALVFTGPNVTRFVDGYLSPKPRLAVATPSTAAGIYEVGTATFGPALGPDVSGSLVLAQSSGGSEACTALTNASAVRGNLALVDRGTCNFTVKAKNAQNAGAIGVVIVNNQPGLLVMTGTDASITIPAVDVSQADGARLRASLPATAALGVDRTLLSGADASGRVLLYAPDPVEPGSSVSHFDQSVIPSLLMAPILNDDLTHTTDATIEAMKDLGWFLPPAPSATGWILPSAAHAPGAGGAFFTTDLFIRNPDPTTDARVTLTFLGNGRDGRGGPVKTLDLPRGQALTLTDVLASAFGVTGSDFGAIRVTSTSPRLVVIGQTSTPAPGGGTFGQSVPAASSSDLVVHGTPRSIVAIREGSGFRTNLVLTNATQAALDVRLTLIDDAGTTYGPVALPSFLPLEMRQIGHVAQSFPGAGAMRSGTLVLSTPTVEGAFAAYASVIDDTTNDPRTLLPNVDGPATWLLPSSAWAFGGGGAFYTTDLTIGNGGVSDAKVTLKLLGHDEDGTTGRESTVTVPAGRTVTYADVLGSLFGVTSDYGAIRISSSSPSLNILGQTSTPGAGGTFGQSVTVASPSDLVTSKASKTIVGVRENASFRTNLIVVNATTAPLDVDVAALSDDGTVLATQRLSPRLQPLEMRQLTQVLATSGAVNAAKTPTVLTLSTPTADGRFAAYASTIDNVTNDPRTLVPR